jgi:hypothetical protein
LRLIQERLKSRRVTQIWFGNKRREGCPGLIQWFHLDCFPLTSCFERLRTFFSLRELHISRITKLSAICETLRYNQDDLMSLTIVWLRKTQTRLDTCAVKSSLENYNCTLRSADAEVASFVWLLDAYLADSSGKIDTNCTARLDGISERLAKLRTRMYFQIFTRNFHFTSLHDSNFDPPVVPRRGRNFVVTHIEPTATDNNRQLTAT